VRKVKGKEVGDSSGRRGTAWIHCRVPNRPSEEFFIVWYHVRVVMVDWEGEGGAGGASVQVGRPVVGVERVERGVGRGKPELLLLPLWPMTAPS